MPELPEVQTIVNDLKKKIIGLEIVDVWSDWPKLVKNSSLSDFKKGIIGLRITDVRRKGKNILIYLQKPIFSNHPWRKKRVGKLVNKQDLGKKNSLVSYVLLIHQKMTGHLLYGQWQIKKNRSKVYVKSLIPGPLQEKVNDYIHLIFYLNNKMQLALSDLRKFAKVRLGRVEEIEKLPELVKLGPDPLDKNFLVNQFVEIISRERRKIKQVLMDPYVISGIGNIYSDDILWRAKIHPARKANLLSNAELKSIYFSMREILKRALDLRGTSIADFRDTAGEAGFYGQERLVYRRFGENCRRCGEIIKRIKIGGRSAHFCPKCQVE
jgi:formamidopyrimidine-DNA glycosylase